MLPSSVVFSGFNGRVYEGERLKKRLTAMSLSCYLHLNWNSSHLEYCQSLNAAVIVYCMLQVMLELMDKQMW